MSWVDDHLTPVETLLFQSALVKVGHFSCVEGDPCFGMTGPLDNDVFVFVKNPLWMRRDTRDFRFVQKGGVVVHQAGSVIARRAVTRSGDQSYWFGIHPDAFARTLFESGLSANNLRAAIVPIPMLRYRLAAIVNRIEHGTACNVEIDEQVLSLFDMVCRQGSSVTPSSRNRRRQATAIRRQRLADDARAFIDSCLNENIGVNDVARAVGTSPFHLCRTFKEHTGLTLHAYRTRQRLGLVVDALVEGRIRNLTELAISAGFCSHSHLARVFRRQIGTTLSSLQKPVSDSALPRQAGNRKQSP